MVADRQALSDALAVALAGPLGGDIEIDRLERLSGGASRETWAVDAVTGGERQELILQRSLTGDVGSLAKEAAVLRLVADHDVPAPPLVAALVDEADDVLGRYTITHRLPGESIARRILRDDTYAAARPRLAAQLGRAAALVHSMPADAAMGLDAPDPLELLRLLLGSHDVPSPSFELALRWLDQHRPAGSGRTVVHGDLRLGNVLVDAEGLVALLDWELVHIGDPMEDIGWLCVRAWRFGGRGRVAGVGSLDDLTAGYEQVSGTSLDADVVRWWEICGNLRWGLICMSQAQRHLSGATRSVELAAIGRRVCEQEHELLRLLGVPDPVDPAADPGPAVAGLYGRPTAAELVEATAEMLEDEVMPATEGRLAFQARVAANALRIVERQLARAGADEASHHQRLAALGYDDEEALAADIRSGRCDDRWDEVTAVVAASVRDRLAVANPAWLEGT